MFVTRGSSKLTSEQISCWLLAAAGIIPDVAAAGGSRALGSGDVSILTCATSDPIS